MSVILGSGKFKYEALDIWPTLPDRAKLIETPGVAVNSRDEVFIFSRNVEHPVMVFDRGGNFLRGFGSGIFSDRTHGILIGPDDAVYCVDDGIHTITKFTPGGKLIMTIGESGKSSEIWKGDPFNRPTHAAVSKHSGDIFITDGYGNFRVHKYTATGEYVKSWGGPGIDPGQFLRPHNIAVDDQDRVIVADREAHRVQVFDVDGNVLDVWNNIFMPNGLTIGHDGNIYIGELPGMTNVDPTPPNHGHNITVMSPKGERLARIGDEEEGENPGQFIAPHGIGVDSHGDIYIGEVSYTVKGSFMNPPQELRSLSKLRKLD